MLAMLPGSFGIYENCVRGVRRALWTSKGPALIDAESDIQTYVCFPLVSIARPIDNIEVYPRSFQSRFPHQGCPAFVPSTSQDVHDE